MELLEQLRKITANKIQKIENSRVAAVVAGEHARDEKVKTLSKKIVRLLLKDLSQKLIEAAEKTQISYTVLDTTIWYGGDTGVLSAKDQSMLRQRWYDQQRLGASAETLLADQGYIRGIHLLKPMQKEVKKTGIPFVVKDVLQHDCRCSGDEYDYDNGMVKVGDGIYIEWN